MHTAYVSEETTDIPTLMLATACCCWERPWQLIRPSGTFRSSILHHSRVDIAQRLLKHAVEIHKPVLMINVGPSRADGIPEVEKVDIESGSIMREVVKMVVSVPRSSSEYLVTHTVFTGALDGMKILSFRTFSARVLSRSRHNVGMEETHKAPAPRTKY